jgi:hypothetical protein
MNSRLKWVKKTKVGDVKPNRSSEVNVNVNVNVNGITSVTR